ncbi:MAG: hypothetical protein JRF17_12130 [Deltaproteobacteria bacterium]|jgi:hypothetical protein|nr:hypothetical protein [Deltaproteobacteria bacterium]
MSSYQKEQAEALNMVYRHLKKISAQERKRLLLQISDYLMFRNAVDIFLVEHFENICTQKCYQSQKSACCSRDSTITFFADVVVNVLVSTKTDVEALMGVLEKPNDGFKCVYLGDHGCLWQIKPIICQMFLCDPAKESVFKEKPLATTLWLELKQREKHYRWPDRPVLFDDLEKYFMAAGYSSPLMYLHNSPGLLRVKERAKKNNQK